MNIEKEIEVEKFDCLYEKTLVNLVFTYNWINTKLKCIFEPFHITVQQYNILRILKGQCKPATLNLLKDRMLDKMSDASRIVERLLQKELVERKVCPLDRRAVDISISQKGLDLLMQLEEHYKVQKVFNNNLFEDELLELNEYLDRLRG